jgi:hypothetical protein
LVYFSLYWYIGGNKLAGYCCFYDFIISELKKPDKDTLTLWNVFRLISENLHYYFTFKDIVFCSERPIEMHFKGNDLHNENEAAVQYKDGYSIYSLNGINVPEKIVLTKPENMDKEFLSEYYFKNENAEIRREIVRKMGYELFANRVEAKSIDRKGEMYELLEIDLQGSTGKWPFLKMRNPSIDVWHIEPVSKECKTVDHALNSRKPEKLKNIPVSENGSDWYQQGDVCIWPKKAEFVKPYPSILT